MRPCALGGLIKIFMERAMNIYPREKYVRAVITNYIQSRLILLIHAPEIDRFNFLSRWIDIQNW